MLPLELERDELAGKAKFNKKSITSTKNKYWGGDDVTLFYEVRHDESNFCSMV